MNGKIANTLKNKHHSSKYKIKSQTGENNT